MKVEKVIPNVYWVAFTSRKRMSETFMRFSEYYESPQFRGKVFTKAEFLASYGDSYYKDWEGFNIPSYVLEPFLNGEMGELDTYEKEFLKFFKNKTGPFYIIGTMAKDRNCYNHELAHALYYLNEPYRKLVKQLMRRYDTRAFKKHLLDIGYVNEVLDDEVHAYCVANLDFIKYQEFKKYEQLKALRRELRLLFKAVLND